MANIRVPDLKLKFRLVRIVVVVSHASPGLEIRLQGSEVVGLGTDGWIANSQPAQDSPIDGRRIPFHLLFTPVWNRTVAN